MDNYSTGERLRSLRKQKNLTQDDLANMLDISRVQVNRWESGACEISNSKIIKLSEIFNTSCDYLMRGIETFSPNNIESKESGEPKTPFEHAGTANENVISNFSKDTLNALRDLSELDSRKKQQYVNILNGILGSNSFWKVLMPAAAAAYTVKEQSAFGGLTDEKPPLSDELEAKLKTSEEIVKLGNSVGYMDSVLISNEQAYSFQLSEAAKAFKSILDASINHNTLSVSQDEKFWCEAYKTNDVEDNTDEFKKFFKLFGLNIL